MIKVHYPHPPRKWDFYLGLIKTLSLINLPVICTIVLWMPYMPLGISLAAALLSAVLRVVIFWRSLLEGYIMDYDSKLDKSKDISHDMGFPPAVLEAPIRLAESLGFARLGETSSYFGLSNKPHIEWILVNESKDIVMQVSELAPLTPYFVGFSSWFDKDQLVITMYPFGDSIDTEDFRTEGIKTSLEAAYNYHLRQVAEFESMYGAPIKFDSLDAVRSYNPIYVQKHQKRLHSAVNLRSILIWMIGTIFISALVFWAISLLWIAQDGLYKENLQVMLNASYMALAYVLIGLVLLGLIALRLRPSRNIQRAKKKEA